MNPEGADQNEQSASSRPIVVGVAGMETDAAAFTWAAKAAHLHGVPLRVVHAQESTTGGARENDPDALREQGPPPNTEKVVAEIGERYPDLDVQYTQATGAASRALLSHQDNALMIVVGSGQKGGRGHFLLGTTSLNTAMHARCPVAVVNHGVEVTPELADRVLVAVDGSRDSAAAAEVAFEEAALRQAPVVCVNSWYLEMVDGSVVTEPDSPEWKATEDRQRERVEAAIKGPRSRFPDVEVQLEIMRGPTTRVLTQATGRADLMVIGTRGHGAFAGKLMGSVSHEVLQAAVCPVIVVKATKHD